jgi:outer membrane protein
MPLYQWGQKKMQIQQAVLDAQANLYSIEKIKNDMGLNIATTFLRILLSQEQINIAKQQLQQSNLQAAQTQKLIDAGTIPLGNKQSVLVQIANNQSQIIGAQADSISAILQLKALLNFDFNSNLNINLPTIDINQFIVQNAQFSFDDIFAQAQNTQPQIKANQIKLQSAKKATQIIQASLYPSLSLGYNLGTNYSSSYKEITGKTFAGTQPIGSLIFGGTAYDIESPVFDYQTRTTPYFNQIKNNIRHNVGLSINVPIFNQFQVRTNISKSKINIQNQEILNSQDIVKLKQDIYQSISDSKQSLQKYKATLKSVEAAEEALKYASKRYELGAITSYEYENARNNLFSAKSQEILSKYDFVFKTLIINFYQGKPLTL